jgi:hypothetical protein
MNYNRNHYGSSDTDLTPGAVEAHGGVSEFGPELRLEMFVAEVAFALQSKI